MLSYTLFEALTFPVTYLLVAILVLTAVLQIKYLNRALSRFNATQVIPTQFVLFTLSVILGSAVLYRDFERTSGEQAAKFVAGCALTFLGVWFITSSRERESDEEEGFEEDDNAIRLQGEQAYRDFVENTPSPRKSPTHVNASKTSLQNGRAMPRRRTSESITVPSLSTSLIPEGSSPIPTPQERQPLSAAPSVPSTYTEASSISEHAWSESGQHTPRNRLSVQRLLQPLTTLFPHSTSQLHLPANPAASTSTPILPSEDAVQPARPETPHGHTHAPEHLTPTTPHTADPARLARQSFSALYPAPLSAPLSTPLSAIIAASLRGGVARDPTRSSARRARKPRLPLPALPWSAAPRARATSEPEAAAAAAAAAQDAALRDVYAASPSRGPKVRAGVAEGVPRGGDGGAEGQGAAAGERRGRSLSATLVDLLRRKRRRVDGLAAGEEVAVGSEPATPVERNGGGGGAA